LCYEKEEEEPAAAAEEADAVEVEVLVK